MLAASFALALPASRLGLHLHAVIRAQVLEPILLLGFPRFANVDIRVRVKGGGYIAQVYGALEAVDAQPLPARSPVPGVLLAAIRQAIGKAIVAFYQKCACSLCQRAEPVDECAKKV